ncbi:protein of unknown function DUF178 [Evansella cellulosilytica DSM 2522]|uniref:Chorismate dehydratase n=2 Tax=Evansella TaxID=2837485 RepID=E6TZF7_EVAC2|nr:protein of unknown function DUF178 [Evansella cellulosilytica DSM 2522]
MGLAIGEISYTNILPFFYYVDRFFLGQNGCTFIPKVPSELNDGMEKGVIDVGGISSFSYGENYEEYMLLPNFSVSSPREVGSIFLFSKLPITELHNKTIALTSSSATSVNLLKIILQKFYSLEVSYVTMEPDYDSMLKEYDACLLIGDDAITASWNKREDIHKYDLGTIWEHFTGYPMTYAVFAVRKSACEKHPILLDYLYKQFLYSKTTSIHNHFEEIIYSIQKQLGGKKSFWKNYYHGLNYDLTERHVAGLYHYFNLAYEMNLLENKVANISFWSPTKHSHSV